MKMGIEVNGVQVQFYLDTGAEVSIVNRHLTTLVLLVFRNVTKWHACITVRRLRSSVMDVLCSNFVTMQPKMCSTSQREDP